MGDWINWYWSGKNIGQLKSFVVFFEGSISDWDSQLTWFFHFDEGVKASLHEIILFVLDVELLYGLEVSFGETLNVVNKVCILI